MPVKRSLNAKMLILISVPLCFEIGFVGLLAYFQNEAEEDARRALEARKLSDQVNKLTGDIFDAYNLPNVNNNRSKLLYKGYLLRLYKPAIRKLRDDYTELARLTQDKPMLSPVVSQSLKSLTEAESILLAGAHAIDSGQIDMVLQNYSGQSDHLGSLLKGLISNELLLVARHEREFADTSHERQSQFRAQIQVAALITCAFTVVFSIALAIFLVKRITARLAIMSENADNFARGEPLHEPLRGNDEIADLDRVFHSMTKSVQEAAQLKQELVLMLTHDLRSPLTAIQGSLDMLQNAQSQELTERSRKMVHLAERNTIRMMSLINDLLDIEKIKSGMMTLNKSQVCLAELFEEVRVNVADWIDEHGIHLVVKDTALFVLGDEKKLSRVVFNLISNAIRFSPPNTTITLAAEQLGNQIEVTVTDQGPGIPANMLETIFERFQQGSTDETKTKGGSGLGLAACQAIVNLHGGRIWATSTLGQGSTFHFTVPEG